jgi:hypothetical protein
MKAYLFCLFYAGQLISSELPQGTSKYYEINEGSRTLVMSVAEESQLGERRKTKLKPTELLRFFPEKNKTAFASENEQEIVVAVIVAQKLFVYGRDWSAPDDYRFSFRGQWLDNDGQNLGDVFSFKNPCPQLSPTLKLVFRSQNNMKMSRRGGIGFICYDLTQQKPEEARFLKIKVRETKWSNFNFVMELPAVQ